MKTADPAWTSAIYEGVVRHRRHGDCPHAFRYRVAQLYLDLDEVERVFAGHWLWSVNRRNLAQFRRSDYLAPHDRPLAEASLRIARAEQTSMQAVQPICSLRLWAHRRCW